MTAEPETPAVPTPRRPEIATTAPRIETQTPRPAELPVTPIPPQRQPSSLLSRGDRTRNRGAIEARIGKIREAIGQLDRRNLDGFAKDDRDRAAAMADLAEQALKRGDLRQADDLSSRAAILTNTLVHAQ